MVISGKSEFMCTDGKRGEGVSDLFYEQNAYEQVNGKWHRNWLDDMTVHM